MAACIRAIGGACRIVLLTDGSRGHAFAEVYVGDATNAIAAYRYIVGRYSVLHVFLEYDTAGWWLSLDWSGSNPGRTPLIEPKNANWLLYVPIYSVAALVQDYPLPVPSVP